VTDVPATGQATDEPAEPITPVIRVGFCPAGSSGPDVPPSIALPEQTALSACTVATKAQLPQIATALNKLVAVQRDEATKLKAIPDPDRDAAVFHTAFAGFQQQINMLTSAAQVASSGNVNAFHTAAQGLASPAAGLQSRANAKKFGLKVCGQGGGQG